MVDKPLFGVTDDLKKLLEQSLSLQQMERWVESGRNWVSKAVPVFGMSDVGRCQCLYANGRGALSKHEDETTHWNTSKFITTQLGRVDIGRSMHRCFCDPWRFLSSSRMLRLHLLRPELWWILVNDFRRGQRAEEQL